MYILTVRKKEKIRMNHFKFIFEFLFIFIFFLNPNHRMGLEICLPCWLWCINIMKTSTSNSNYFIDNLQLFLKYCKVFLITPLKKVSFNPFAKKILSYMYQKWETDKKNSMNMIKICFRKNVAYNFCKECLIRWWSDQNQKKIYRVNWKLYFNLIFGQPIQISDLSKCPLLMVVRCNKLMKK